MRVLRKILEKRIGFTLVELMVVVVVLGILAGIAVQRMGDVRERAENAAREANVRLLLGAANLAITRNYGDHMYIRMNHATYPDGKLNATIRWQRPCHQEAVTQMMTQGVSIGHYVHGYESILDFDTNGWNWNTSQEWNLTDYLESFPVGYAVEIVFAARDWDPLNQNTDPILGGNRMPYRAGYHIQRDYQVYPNNNPYDKDQIVIYKIAVDVDTEEYPYDVASYGGGWGSVGHFDPSDWKEVFPEDRW